MEIPFDSNRMLSESVLLQMKNATQRSASAMGRALNENGANFSVVQFINSRLRDGVVTDQRALEATMNLSSIASKSAGGAHCDGAWLPFQALTRDLTLANSASLGVQHKGDLAQSLVAIPSILGAGCTVITGLQGTAGFGIPTIDTGIDLATTGSWVAENGTAPAREPTFANRVLTSKTLTAEIVISRRLLHMTGPALETELRREITRRALNEIDRAIVSGDGTNQPLGLLGESIETLAVGVNGGAPTWAHAVALESAVSTRTGKMAAPAFILHPTLRAKLRNTQRGAGLDYIMTGAKLLENEVHASALIPTNLTKGSGTALTALIYGDLAEVVVGFWGPAAVDLLVDGYSRSSTGAVRLIARVEVGMVVRQVGAFSIYKDINPA